MIPEHYIRIAKRWAWLIAGVVVACVLVAVLAVPALMGSSVAAHSAATTLGVTRLVSASGSVTTAGGTGTPELLSNYTQSVADRGNTPQFQKELQDRLAAQGVIVPAAALAKKVVFKPDVGLFRVTVTASDASATNAQIIADTAAALVTDDITAEEGRVKADLTSTTALQQTQLLAQLNAVYAARTTELANVGEPAIRAALDDLVRSGVGQDPSKTFTALVANLARLGSDPQLAVLNSQATSLETQLGALSDLQRSFSDQILQGKPLSVVDPTSTVQLAPPTALRTRDLALMGIVAGLVLGWIAAAVTDGFIVGRRMDRARREEWETVNTARVDRYFSHD
ncbi:MAG: hypothetical protein ABI559_06895 [Chloroflexota bacterium]